MPYIHMSVEFAPVHKTEFPQNYLSPVQLYTALYASRVATDPLSVVDHCSLYPGSILRRNTEYREVYFCGPLTSAGAIRIPNNDPKTAFGQNVIVAETFRDALIPQLEEETPDMRVHLTIPGHVGVRNYADNAKWGEGEYNLFWLYYMSGIDPVSAMRFDKKVSTKEAIKRINNKNMAREQYRPAYQGMVDDFIATVIDPNSGCRLNKMSQIVTLPDSQFSFGSQMELRLAKGIGITIKELRINPEWVKQQSQLWFNQYQQLNKLDEMEFILPKDESSYQISAHRVW